MSALRHAARRLASDERGFSLVELMIVIMVLGVMLGAVLTTLEATHRSAPRDQERADVIRESQQGMGRMTRELRHAHRVSAAGQWSITASVMKGGVATQITYDCSTPDPKRAEYRICMRSATPGGGSQQQVISRVLLDAPAGGGSPPDVFTYRTNAAGRINYVGVSVVTAASGDVKGGYKHKVTLRDGFFLRNVDTCGPQAPVACP